MYAWHFTWFNGKIIQLEQVGLSVCLPPKSGGSSWFYLHAHVAHFQTHPNISKHHSSSLAAEKSSLHNIPQRCRLNDALLNTHRPQNWEARNEGLCVLAKTQRVDPQNQGFYQGSRIEPGLCTTVHLLYIDHN